MFLAIGAQLEHSSRCQVFTYYSILHVPSVIIISKYLPNWGLQYINTIRYHESVVLDGLHPPPSSIPAVEPGSQASSQEVGDQPMTDGGAERQNGVPGDG